MLSLEDRQRLICVKYNAKFQPCNMNLKVGVSKNLKEGKRPINGLRIKDEAGTSGWYIWAGEWSNDPDFFVPLHGVHLNEWAEIVLPYLGLPEGWRFLVTEDYDDVWQDPELINNSK